MSGDREKQNKKNAANQQKWFAAVHSGVPGGIRTHGLSLRRWPQAT